MPSTAGTAGLGTGCSPAAGGAQRAPSISGLPCRRQRINSTAPAGHSGCLALPPPAHPAWGPPAAEVALCPLCGCGLSLHCPVATPSWPCPSSPLRAPAGAHLLVPQQRLHDHVHPAAGAVCQPQVAGVAGVAVPLLDALHRHRPASTCLASIPARSPVGQPACALATGPGHGQQGRRGGHSLGMAQNGRAAPACLRHVLPADGRPLALAVGAQPAGNGCQVLAGALQGGGNCLQTGISSHGCLLLALPALPQRVCCWGHARQAAASAGPPRQAAASQLAPLEAPHLHSIRREQCRSPRLIQQVGPVAQAEHLAEEGDGPLQPGRQGGW